MARASISDLSPTTDVSDAALQPGVVLAGDYALTINTTAQVTIAAGVAYVPQTLGLMVRAVTLAGTVLAAIPVATGANLRLDQVVVDATGVVSRLQGVEGAAVSLANRTGAAAIPAGSQLLHDMLVTNGGVLAANVRDRRPWARGASHFYQDAGPRTWAVAGGATNIPLRRLEIGANSWLQVILTVNLVGATVGGRVDTQPVVAGSGFDRNIRVRMQAVGGDEGHSFSWSGAVAAGSNTVTFNGTAQDGATTANSITVTLIEHVRQNANNGTT